MAKNEAKNTIELMEILSGLATDYADQAKRINRFVEQLAEINDEDLLKGATQENTLHLLQNFNIVMNQAAVTQRAMRRFQYAREGI